MRIAPRLTLPWQIAITAALFFALIQAGMFESRAQTPTAEPKTKPQPVKKAVAPAKPLDSSIEQVRVTRQQGQTEVRVEGSGRLYCVPFLLSRPDRLVLDFPGATMRVQRPSILGDVPPVRSVRFSQFRPVIARLVIDLNGQAPYLLIARENFVTVVFDSPRDERSPTVVGVSATTSTLTQPSPNQVQRTNDGKPSPGLFTNSAAPALTNSAAKNQKKPVELGAFAWATPVPSKISTPSSVDLPSTREQSHPSVTPSSSLPQADESSSATSISLHEHAAAKPVVAAKEATTVDPAAPVKPANTDQDSNRPELQRRGWRYRILPGDVLEVSFIFTPEFDQVLNVQPDGYVTLKGIGSLRAQGQTTAEFTQALVAAYGKVLRDPVITVNLNDFVKPYFIVDGQVDKPGKFELRGETTVTEAVAMAGGFKETAKHSQVVLFRKVSEEWTEVKVLNVKHMLNTRNLAEDVYLRPGDMLYVPKNAISKIKPWIPTPSVGGFFDFSRYF